MYFRERERERELNLTLTRVRVGQEFEHQDYFVQIRVVTLNEC